MRARDEQLGGGGLFDQLVEGVQDYAILLLDPAGHIASWNTGAQRIKGYTAEEIIGKHFSQFYPREAVEAGWPDEELRRAAAAGRFEDESWRVRKDGTRFWGNVIITSLRDPDGQLIGYSKVTRDLTERKRAEEALLRSNEDLERRVVERTAELARANALLQAEVADRRRAEEALKEADHRKDEFLAMLGHELRNPLAPIRNVLHLLTLPGTTEADIREAGEIIGRQVEHLVRLVDDLLDVARITHGSITLKKEPLSLAEIVARAVETTQPALDAHGHELTVTLPAEPLRVEGDPIRLAQVVGNLLQNAAKYTERAGRIQLDVARDGGEVVLRVRDQGVGIAPELLPHVFGLFVQAERTLARSQGGLGLGLTLARRLIESHGGSIVAASPGLGLGSEFTVRLPALAREPAAEGGRVRRDRAQAAHPSRRILVVDDNVDAAESLARLLTRWGHKVKTTYDGPSALDAALAHRPEVVLLDIGLPVMDGYEVARRLRSQPAFEAVPLAAVTGYGQDEDQRRSREAGFDHHFTKPLNTSELQEFLATFDRR